MHTIDKTKKKNRPLIPQKCKPKDGAAAREGVKDSHITCDFCGMGQMSSLQNEIIVSASVLAKIRSYRLKWSWPYNSRMPPKLF